MTAEKAIEILKDEHDHIICHLGVEGKDAEYYKELGELAEAMHMGIEALKGVE